MCQCTEVHVTVPEGIRRIDSFNNRCVYCVEKNTNDHDVIVA